jgi:acyl-CoA synthetase (AMP-forming)/AMP-acid ligase II
VEKGDKVCIYMPMVPKLPIAMLTCAKIGAIHSVCPSLCISYSPLNSEFLWCHIANEVPRVFVRYDDLDKAWLELQKLWYKGVSKNM